MTNLYDTIKEKENQIGRFQTQISELQSEIEALRVAVQILGKSSGAPPEVHLAPVGAGRADKGKQAWP
jgi:prefoldin subunit 5